MPKKLLQMSFEKKVGWLVTFRDTNDSRAQFRRLSFADSSKIEELIARSGTKVMLEDRQALELGLRQGRGATRLTLSSEQYRRLVL
jgi:hypothetical protein